jgi:lysophospholipase L1-like esterase
MILTLGDSVCWGQGLREEHKFDSLYANSKGSLFVRAAHSGAVIGTPADSSTEVENGEVPVPAPSVWQQVLAPRDWSPIELVLLNGGINDVSLTRILNPAIGATQLEGLVNQFCNTGMVALLEAAAAKLILPQARIAVIGYFPILSSQSGGTDIQLRSLLELHGVASTSVFGSEGFSFQDLLPRVVENCLVFWNSSDDALNAAVNAVNAALGKPVCIFVKLPFRENNSMWAPQSLLWELNPLLLPEDELVDPREQACQILYGDVVHIPQWALCVRASAGHPNVAGAAKIAAALTATL